LRVSRDGPSAAGVRLVDEYLVTIKPSAVKELHALPAIVATRVASKIKALAATPRPPGVKKLEGEPVRWRIRAGDWRVIYSIDDRQRVVDVIYIRHRSKAYE
jgi:mRNA interferase RelE/StbE